MNLIFSPTIVYFVLLLIVSHVSADAASYCITVNGYLYNSHCYKVMNNTSLDWKSAWKACKTEGNAKNLTGKLADIPSKQMWQSLTNYLQQDGDTNIWIGAKTNLSGSNCCWNWMNSTIDWGQNFKNSLLNSISSDVSHVGNECLQIRDKNGWCDANCSMPTTARLCEYADPKSNDQPDTTSTAASTISADSIVSFIQTNSTTASSQSETKIVSFQSSAVTTISRNVSELTSYVSTSGSAITERSPSATTTSLPLSSSNSIDTTFSSTTTYIDSTNKMVPVSSFAVLSTSTKGSGMSYVMTSTDAITKISEDSTYTTKPSTIHSSSITISSDYPTIAFIASSTDVVVSSTSVSASSDGLTGDSLSVSTKPLTSYSEPTPLFYDITSKSYILSTRISDVLSSTIMYALSAKTSEVSPTNSNANSQHSNAFQSSDDMSSTSYISSASIISDMPSSISASKSSFGSTATYYTDHSSAITNTSENTTTSSITSTSSTIDDLTISTTTIPSATSITSENSSPNSFRNNSSAVTSTFAISSTSAINEMSSTIYKTTAKATASDYIQTVSPKSSTFQSSPVTTSSEIISTKYVTSTSSNIVITTSTYSNSSPKTSSNDISTLNDISTSAYVNEPSLMIQDTMASSTTVDSLHISPKSSFDQSSSVVTNSSDFSSKSYSASISGVDSSTVMPAISVKMTNSENSSHKPQTTIYGNVSSTNFVLTSAKTDEASTTIYDATSYRTTNTSSSYTSSGSFISQSSQSTTFQDFSSKNYIADISNSNVMTSTSISATSSMKTLEISTSTSNASNFSSSITSSSSDISTTSYVLPPANKTPPTVHETAANETIAAGSSSVATSYSSSIVTSSDISSTNYIDTSKMNIITSTIMPITSVQMTVSENAATISSTVNEIASAIYETTTIIADSASISINTPTSDSSPNTIYGNTSSTADDESLWVFNPISTTSTMMITSEYSSVISSTAEIESSVDFSTTNPALSTIIIATTLNGATAGSSYKDPELTTPYSSPITTSTTSNYNNYTTTSNSITDLMTSTTMSATAYIAASESSTLNLKANDSASFNSVDISSINVGLSVNFPDLTEITTSAGIPPVNDIASPSDVDIMTSAITYVASVKMTTAEDSIDISSTNYVIPTIDSSYESPNQSTSDSSPTTTSSDISLTSSIASTLNTGIISFSAMSETSASVEGSSTNYVLTTVNVDEIYSTIPTTIANDTTTAGDGSFISSKQSTSQSNISLTNFTVSASDVDTNVFTSMPVTSVKMTTSEMSSTIYATTTNNFSSSTTYISSTHNIEGATSSTSTTSNNFISINSNSPIAASTNEIYSTVNALSSTMPVSYVQSTTADDSIIVISTRATPVSSYNEISSRDYISYSTDISTKATTVDSNEIFSLEHSSIQLNVDIMTSAAVVMPTTDTEPNTLFKGTTSYRSMESSMVQTTSTHFDYTSTYFETKPVVDTAYEASLTDTENSQPSTLITVFLEASTSTAQGVSDVPTTIVTSFARLLQSTTTSLLLGTINITQLPETITNKNASSSSSIEKLVKRIVQSLGCSYIISILASIIIIFQLFLRNYTFDRLLHLVQEFVLFMAHLDLVLFYDSTDNNVLCICSAVFLQLCFTTFFTFQAIEALHIYCSLTHTFHVNEFGVTWSLGFGVPTFITAISALAYHDQYPGEFTCWLNLATNASKVVYLPMLGIISFTIVLLEASAIERKTHLKHLDRLQWNTIIINHGALAILLPSNVIAMVLGQVTMYFQNIALLTITFGFNVTNACFILMFHALGNNKFRKLVKKTVKTIKTLLKC